MLSQNRKIDEMYQHWKLKHYEPYVLEKNRENMKFLQIYLLQFHININIFRSELS